MPEATFYSDSDFPDFRDASLKGYEEAMKIIDMRACNTPAFRKKPIISLPVKARSSRLCVKLLRL
jgi:hypothetical protein